MICQMQERSVERKTQLIKILWDDVALNIAIRKILVNFISCGSPVLTGLDSMWRLQRSRPGCEGCLLVFFCHDFVLLMSNCFVLELLFRHVFDDVDHFRSERRRGRQKRHLESQDLGIGRLEFVVI